MKYRTLRCPHCNQQIEHMKPVELGLGSPVVSCPVCNKHYIDKSQHEWETMPLFSKIGFILQFILSMFVYQFMGAYVLLVGITYFIVFKLLSLIDMQQMLAASVLVCIPIATCYFAYKLYVYSSWIRKQIRESKKRLSVKNYALTLKSCGFHVSSKYIDA